MWKRLIWLEEDYEEGYCAWVLENARPIRPFPIRGQQGLYRCTFEPEFITPDELDALIVKETPSSSKSKTRKRDRRSEQDR